MFWTALNLLIFSTICLCLSLILDDIGTLQRGKSLTGHNFLFFHGQTLQSCFRECRSRKKCRSFNYNPTETTCTLNRRSLETVASGSLKETPGFVFSDRSDWKKDKPSPCQSYEMHDETNEVKPCSITECDDPEPIGKSRILGNMKWIGKKVRYVCYRGIDLLDSYISTCLENGSWSKNHTFTCDYTESCPVEYESYEVGSFRYKICQMCETWTRAREICQEDGGDLLTLHTDDEFDYFLPLINSITAKCRGIRALWIGASDDREGNWAWINGQQLPRNEPHWHEGEPNNPAAYENCAEIYFDNENTYTSLLSDYLCEEKQQFICKNIHSVIHD